jgi:hypothetical protein
MSHDGTNDDLAIRSSDLVINEAGSNRDFRVESDTNANMLFVDGGNNKVGIGTNTAQASLTVAGGAPAASSPATYSGTIQINETALSTLQEVGGLEFRGAVFGSGYGSKITSTDTGHLLFGRRSNNATWSESMRLDGSSGAATFASSISADGQITSARGSDTSTYGFRHEGAGKYLRMGVPNASFAYFETDANGGFSFEGNVTVPNQILHAGDTDTYMQFHAVNEWRVVAGGYERFAIGTAVVVNEDSHDADFRVESDSNANGLMLDASTSTVGVNRAASAGVGLSVNATATNSSTYAFEACNSSSNTKFIVRSDGYSGFYKSSNAGGFIHNTDGAITITPDAGGHFVFNEDSVDADFRVESDNDSSALFVDASADSVSLRQHKFAATPTSTNNDFVHFNTGSQLVNQGASTTVNLFLRSASGSAVPCAGTAYVSCEASGQNVSWSYIIDFFYDNNAFTTTARATGSSQGTATCSVQENGVGVSVTVAYIGGLGGNMKFNASGFANVGNY